MKRLCVFAGSAKGSKAAYAEAARGLGAAAARRGIGIVYGGAAYGLMGICADGALAGGGEVIGVLPQALSDREKAHPRLSELRIVGTLHARKATMAALADAFVALPGGCGTLDELFEAITWRQLALHAKPIGLYDVEGYFEPLLTFLRAAAEEGFVPKATLVDIAVRSEAGALLDSLLPG
ncbi:MAG: TIGR00730 family Rossman fold protein [Myxococcales bacterium]